MPELPEVQVLSELLTERAVGRTVRRVDVMAISALATYDPPVTVLSGRLVGEAGRRGKFLYLRCDDPGTGDLVYLVFHLARAGWLRWKDEMPATPPRPGKGPLAVRLALSADGADAGGFELTEAGTQKRLAVYVVRDPDDVAGVARLGIDPLEPGFTVDVFAALLRTQKGQLKGVLRNQELVAGIGNAYSDEILHAARLSPFASAAGLRDVEIARLHEAVASVLTDAVDRARGAGAGTLKSEKKSGMRVHGRTGEACPVCGSTILEVSFADSSLQYCPTCQTNGRTLADRRLSRLLK